MAELMLGVLLGLGAGFSPGPFLVFVLTTTLQKGLLAGVRVACSPLFTDAPVILLSVLLVSNLPVRLAAALEGFGGLFVLYLGWETLRASRHASLEPAGAAPTSAVSADLWRGMVVNLLSPHPWLFWLGVGGPQLVQAWHKGPGNGLAFLLGFYALLVGSKVAIAAALAFGRRWLSLGMYRGALAVGGVVLCAVGASLVLSGVRAW